MIKDQESAKQVLESIDLALQATIEISRAVSIKDYEIADIISSDLKELLNTLLVTGKQIYFEHATISICNIFDSLLDSLNRLLSFIRNNDDKALSKIEFEFMPLLQDAYMQIYFWGCVYPDSNRMSNYYRNEKKILNTNVYIEEAEKSGLYKYELSIIVVAYNKLDYTKLCVGSILKTIPQNLNYELILINHGSSDGTKEYFESINPTKQLDIKVNGALGATSLRIIEGEYVIAFSNDIVAGENAIENMLRCMKENPGFGFGVPTTPNVSNLQTIPFEYSTVEEMREFCSKNNVYDPFRHEQRTRLCNPVSFYRSYTAISSIGIAGHYFTHKKLSYPDDVVSMLFRRNGYKNVLANDSFCHHFGSITIKDDLSNTNEYAEYMSSRHSFIGVFGIDPWGTGFCYDPALLPLMELLPCEKISILGINSGLGNNPLKIKELYKEKQHKLDVTVYNVTDQHNYLEDLRGVSDFACYFESVDNMFSNSDYEYPYEYHHIVIDVPLESLPKCMALINECLNHLVDNGFLYVNVGEKALEQMVRERFPESSFNENWARLVRKTI